MFVITAVNRNNRTNDELNAPKEVNIIFLKLTNIYVQGDILSIKTFSPYSPVVLYLWDKSTKKKDFLILSFWNLDTEFIVIVIYFIKT